MLLIYILGYEKKLCCESDRKIDFDTFESKIKSNIRNNNIANIRNKNS
jgi:hypothetical protein